jgi:serine/threonine protein kinase
MKVGIPLGPYRLVRRLATGGMAEIFLARQEGKDGFSRDLVVKRILPHLAADPEFKRMFQGEARLAAHLSHPNVVHVYDYGSVVDEGEETFYLAMELVRGVDLRALIVRAAEGANRHGSPYSVPPHHAAKIASFVCEALAYAHDLVVEGKRANIVHRDVTPSNVLLSFDGAVKLADFGIAKSLGGKEETEHGIVKGKSTYLSPEQARGEHLDRRSDLFNVGILLFESVLGQPLFPHGDPRRARILSARGEIPDRLRLKLLPGPLTDIAERALAAQREDRYPDALSMRADLEAFLRKCPEPSDSVEIGRFVRALFPDTVAEDAKAVRAAGTVAKTGVMQPSRPGTAVIDPSAASGETPLATGEPTLVSAAFVTPADPTPPPDITAPYLPNAIPSPASGTTFSAAHGSLSKGTPAAARPALSAAETTARTRGGGNRIAIAGALVVALVGGGLAYAAFALGGPPDVPTAPPSAPPLGAHGSVPAAMAQLRVTTEPPGQHIEVDGVTVGEAPLVRSFTAGAPHVVRALDAASREVAHESVTLTAGEVRELHLVAQVTGASLRVASTPTGASVRVDGQLLGETPLAVEVAPTPHRVELSLAGYETVGDDVTFSAAGEQAMLSFALRRAPVSRPSGDRDRPRPSSATSSATGTLRIATDPYSEVYEGSRHLGTTPLQTTLPVGHHTLSLRSPGHTSRTTDVDIRDGEVTRVRLTL